MTSCRGANVYFLGPKPNPNNNHYLCSLCGEIMLKQPKKKLYLKCWRCGQSRSLKSLKYGSELDTS